MNSTIARGSRLGLRHVVWLALVGSSALACSKGGIDGKAGGAGTGAAGFGATGGSTSSSTPPSGSGGAVATGPTQPGNGSGGDVMTMPDTGMGTGGTTGTGPGTGTGGAGVPPLTVAGTCPSGFVVCSGVCLEASLIGSDCRPLTCAAPPAGTTAPNRTQTTSRGFTWDVSTTGGTTTVTFTPGKGVVNQTTTAVDLYTRTNADTAVTKNPMTAAADGSFTFTSSTLQAGDDLSFYFHSTMTKQTLVNPGPDITPLFDTMWFHQKIGAARDPEPAYPLVTKLAGRFRDRHPNEERFDHFVDTYFAGPTFDMTITDHGDSIDVTIAPQATMNVQAVDFKNFEAMGSGEGNALPQPTPICYTPPAIAAIGVRATPMGPSVWQGHLGGLSYGQLVDWELTFVRSRTYYTEWFQYYVGSGHLQPKVMNPWAHAASFQSVTDVSTDEFGYAQHIPNITPTELADFISGKVLFEVDFGTHVGYNPPTTFDCPRGATPGTVIPTIVTPPPVSPMFTANTAYTNMSLATISRPGFSSSSCFTCHHLDGKGNPADGASMGNTLLKLFASADGKTSSPDATYGTILDTQAPAGATAEAAPSMTWVDVPGTYGDGTPFTLRKPMFSAGTLRDGALGATTHVSPRIPRPVFGLGLIEAVAPESIMALADPDDANHDGVSGRPNLITDPTTGATALGRFGWKAGTTSLREQAATAFVNDMGVTSALYPKHRCGANQPACTSATGGDATPQLTDTDLDHIQSYLRSLSVPPRRNYNDPQAIAGKALFAAIGCVKCHVPNLVTSTKAALPELRGVDIQPFSDLLLHDMGDGLADDAPIEEGTATGSEWRTAPLWGNGSAMHVLKGEINAFDPVDNSPPGGVYLHDGRARSISEAILWHGGEAAPMREAFRTLPADARAQLLAYVAYPFADPLPLHPCPGQVGQ